MPDLDLGAALNAYSESLRALDKPPEDTEAGWLDVPKEAAASIAETVAQPLGAGQVATAVSDPDVSNLLGGLSMMGHEAARGLRESQSKVARRAAEATIIPEEGKPSFLQTPVRSTVMQAAGLAGPGALLAGAAMFAPEGFLAGLITDASAGMVLGVAQTADKAAQYYNNSELTDDKLAEEDPRFKMLTEQGVDPKEARNIRMQEVVRDAPLYANGLAGALGMGVGGRVLRRTTGGTGGVLSRAILGAGENAAGMGGMAAAGTYADQDLEIAQGKRTDYDYRKMFLAAAQGGALGAAMGTVGGVLHKSDGRRVREDNTPTVESTDSSQLDTTNTIALTPETPPAPSVELSTLAAPGSKPVEPSGDKSQGVTEEEVAGLKGELPPKVEPAPTPEPEVPVIHPGEPETPIATAAHPDVPEITPPEPRAAEPVAPTTTAPERAPKPEEPTLAAEPVAPAPVAEARVDPATGRRILEGPRWGEKDEGWQKMPGQTETVRAAPTEEPGVGHSAKKVLDQQAKNHEIATRVLNNEPPLEPFTENTNANREMLRSRLQKQVSEALASGFGVIKKAKGSPFENRIPDRVHKQPGEVMWLADAQRMLRRLNGKKPVTLNELNKFISDENAGRSGQWDVLAARRKDEGTAFGETKKKQAAAEAAPEEIGGGDAMDRLKSSEPTPEDIILQHEEELKRQLEERAANESVVPVEEEPTQEAPSRERPAPKIEGEAYTAVKERTAPVVTTRGRGRYEGMRPKVAEKVKLAERLKEKVKQEKEPPPELMAHLDQTDQISQQAKKFLEWQKQSPEWKKLRRLPGSDYVPQYAEAPPKPFGDFIREYIAQHGYNKVVPQFGASRIVASQFKRTIARLAADTPVYIVDPKIMANSSVGSRALAYHNSVHKFIAIRSDLFAEHRDPAATYQTILHEGVHAALDHLAENNVHARDLIKRMADYVWDEFDAREKFGYLKDPDTAYAFKTYEGYEHKHREFMTQAISSPRFQRELAEMLAPADLVAQLGMNERRPMSMWELFVNAVRKLLRIPKEQHTMLEAVMRATEQLGDLASREHGTSPGDIVMRKEHPYVKEVLMAHEDPEAEGVFRSVLNNSTAEISKFAADPVNRTADFARDVLNQPDLSDKLRKFSNVFLANHMHLQRIKFLSKDIVGKIYNAIERQGTYARKLRDAAAPLIADHIRLEKRLPGLYARYVDLMHDMTTVGADATASIGAGRNRRLQLNQEVQKKLAKGAKIEDLLENINADHVDAILAHPELVKRYNDLIAKEPKFESLVKRTLDYYDEVQLAESKNAIRNALETVPGMDREAIKKRANELSDMKITDENRKALEQELGEHVVEQVEKGKSLVGNGPYAPLIRRGDWVVHGTYKIKAPTNAIQKVGPNVFEFKTKAEAIRFARSTGLHAKYNTAYYDPLTGKKNTKEGGISTAGGPEQRWVAQLQHEHMDMFQTRKEAEAAREDLEKSGVFETLHGPVVRDEFYRPGSELGHGGVNLLLRQLRKTDAYQQASQSQKHDMERAIQLASEVARAGNRVQSRALPRRRVAGFSRDFTRNLEEYNTASSYYRAKQQYRPEIDDMLGELRHSVRNIADKNETLRSVEFKEVDDRARAPNPEEYTGKYTELARRVGIWSYIDRMMRPSHLLLHQTHLPMITAPVIAGRHGIGRTYATIASAWKDAFSVMKAGIIDMKNAAYDPLIVGTDYSKFIGELFSGAKDHTYLLDLFHKLGEDGTIHPQAGIEVHKYTPSRQAKGLLGQLDKGMSWMDTTFRHLTNATEAINRHIGAVSAYRLEFQKLRRGGMSEAEAHAKAVTYAGDILKNTQGLYSSTNAAPLFKVPWARPFLQFKQFPQMMYHLLGRSLLNGFKKMPEGLSREEQRDFRMQRVQSLKSLGYLLATHSLATGMLGGLPTEPLKYVGALTKALGITKSDFSEVERWLQDRAVENLGKEPAEWLMHGVARTLGGDVHHRLGMSSLTSFGLDRVSSAADFKGFLFDQALGAPGGLAADAFNGLKQMGDSSNANDLMAGAAKAIPLQVLRDIHKAYTGKSGDYTYSPGERAARLLGFTPTGEAEHYERRQSVRTQVDEYNKERTNLMRKWADADPEDKASVWSRIQKFNKSRDKDSQITMKQLTDTAKRKKKTQEEGIEGVRLTKKTRFIGERAGLTQ